MTHMLAPCGESEAPQILEILNDAILNTTALYDYRPRTAESMGPWFAAKRTGRFPVLGVFGGGGRLLGFGSYGTFRNWPAYKYSIEHSIYVRPEERGKGIGKALLAGLIGKAQEQDYHALIAGIDSENRASLALHERFGFRRSGTIEHAGFKFGRWLDLVFMQKLLATPAHPEEG